jgi:hypothetical protein
MLWVDPFSRPKGPSPSSLIWLRAKTNAKPQEPSNPAPSSNSNLRFAQLRIMGDPFREKASPGLTARSLGDLNDGPLRAVVAAWGNSARSGILGERSRRYLAEHGNQELANGDR